MIGKFPGAWEFVRVNSGKVPLWGASTHRANKVFLHILSWPAETLRLPPVKQTFNSARCFNGAPVQWKQTDGGLEISIAAGQRDALDTIVELTVEK